MSNKPYSNLKCPNCNNTGNYEVDEDEIFCLHCGLIIQTSYKYVAGMRIKMLTEILDE